MEKLKNGVKSGQLWQIISPPILNENSPNLEGWCKNIQKIKKNNWFPKYLLKGIFKIVKNLLGVLSQDKVDVKKSVSKS